MKTQIRVVLALVATLCGSAAMAQVNMEVKASVTGTCKLVSASPVNFGTLDPATAGDVANIEGKVTYNCSKGKTPASLTIGSKASGGAFAPMKHATLADTIPFSLTWGALPAGKGMSDANVVELTVLGSVLGTDYQDVSAGEYSVLLAVTLTP